MRTKSVRLLAVGAVLLMLGAACAGPKPPIEVGVKEFPINILLGGSDTPQPTRRANIQPFLETPVLAPPEIPITRVAPTPRGPCPEFHPFDAPKYVASNRALNPPVADQTYSFRRKVKGVAAGATTRKVQSVDTNRTFGTDKAFSFQVLEDFGGGETQMIQFLVVPEFQNALPTAPGNAPAAGAPGGGSARKAGVYIEHIKVTGKKPSEFLSDTGLQVLSFPVEQASETSSVAADPSQNTTLIVNSSGLHKIAADKLKVNACGAPIDAWQQSIEIRQISTSGDTTMTGTWGWATQYGALLVYEKVKLTGSTAGEYEATINQLPAPPPGIF